MGWTKHPDAVQAVQGARREAYACIKKTAKIIRQELKEPSDCGGAELKVQAYYLHDELKRFTKLRHAVGGDEDVDLTPYVSLLLTVFPSFKWSVHVR